MGGEDKPTFMQNVQTNWAAFRLFLWNKEKKEFLGRNGKSWAQIGLFYAIFYFFLACFWALMLFIFFQTVSSDEPTFSSYVNIPGLAFTPKFDNDEVVYDPNKVETYQAHVKVLEKIWNASAPENQTGATFVDCTNVTAAEGQFCRFDREVFGPCRPPNFGWDQAKPCLLISLNRVAGWIPEDYDDEDVPEAVKDSYVPGNIAINCMNYKNKNDFSNSTIYPAAGIPFEYYPFVGTTNKTKRAEYIQPYVAVQFQLLEVKKKIKVHCQAYVPNLKPMGGLYDTDFESEVVYEFYLSAPVKDEL